MYLGSDTQLPHRLRRLGQLAGPYVVHRPDFPAAGAVHDHEVPGIQVRADLVGAGQVQTGDEESGQLVLPHIEVCRVDAEPATPLKEDP